MLVGLYIGNGKTEDYELNSSKHSLNSVWSHKRLHLK